MFSLLIKAGTAHLSNGHNCPQEAASSTSLPAFSFQAVCPSSGPRGRSGVLLAVLTRGPECLPESPPLAPQPQPPPHCGLLLYPRPRRALPCNESAHSLHQDLPVMFYRTSNLKLRAYLIFLTQVQTVPLLILCWPCLGGYW